VYTITRHRASPIPSYPKIGRLLITVVGTGETAVQALGLTETEGNASHDLAERLRPELDALAQAAERVGGCGVNTSPIAADAWLARLPRATRPWIVGLFRRAIRAHFCGDAETALAWVYAECALRRQWGQARRPRWFFAAAKEDPAGALRLADRIVAQELAGSRGAA
jgi:hypothetical protein